MNIVTTENSVVDFTIQFLIHEAFYVVCRVTKLKYNLSDKLVQITFKNYCFIVKTKISVLEIA